MGHAEKSPSDHRWPNCHLAIQFDREHPQPDTSGPAAERGTMLHGVAEHILGVIVLDGWGDPEQCSNFIEAELKDLDEVDADLVRQYALKCLKSLVAFNPDPSCVGVESEAKIWYDPNELETGTIDFWLYSDGDLIVRDFKSGTIPVSAENNTQLVAYGWAKLLEVELLYGDVERVSLEICQPSVPGGEFNYWSLSREQLESEAQKLQYASDAINNGSRKAAPSEETCRWCPHIRCAAKIDALKLKLLADQDPDEMLPPSTISYLHSKKKEILAWVKLAEEEIRTHLDDYPAWKLVVGRNNRSFEDEEAVVDTLELFGIEPYVTTVTLLSPAQAEKETGKGVLDDLITSTPGAPALVPSTDKRPTIKDKVKEMLKNE